MVVDIGQQELKLIVTLKIEKKPRLHWQSDGFLNSNINQYAFLYTKRKLITEMDVDAVTKNSRIRGQNTTLCREAFAFS